jgi:asparagine synthase (glutamine-hydrolysing)
MCGICGELAFGDAATSVSEARTRRMADTLRHRGPDAGDVYVSPPVALGHRRLSIIDVKTGRQPISNEDGTIWVVYNGEIYNYRELTGALEAKGHRFRTASDTEVIVHLYEELGERCVVELQGMFSFALWDGRRRVLFLARDRVGIKPLYYARTRDGLLFGSEVKALLAHGALQAATDEVALDAFLTHRFAPGDATLFRGIQKLRPGHYLVADATGRLRVTQYWDLAFSATARDGTLDDRARTLAALLTRTVRNHLISEVPIGVLLSGGIDSTAILSLAAENTAPPVATFTIGFDPEHGEDERAYARLAAARFGTRHFETTISPKSFLATLPAYVWHMEEPVCEPPGVALYLVSRLARQHVTVLLSGEGGDEAFAGYENYRNLLWVDHARRLLGPFSMPASGLLAALSRRPRFRRMQPYAPLLAMPIARYYRSRTAFAPNAHERLYTDDFRSAVTRHRLVASLADPTGSPAREPLNHMLYVDTKTWLPDDLLVKADKLTMANSIELRVPFLDHHVLEFAAALPVADKLRGWSAKRILKAAVRDRVPSAILARPKRGFPVPYARWLRDDLREPLRELLTDRRSVQRGYFRRDAIAALLDHPAPSPDDAKTIFSLVVLELWHRLFVDGTPIVLR